jgi:hypothetical protein
MKIEIGENLQTIIEGRLFATAPTVAELHALLGPSSQVAEPVVRAPVGHRNNRWHVYESLGVYFYEHHFPREITGCCVVFRPEEIGIPIVLRKPFEGLLRLGRFEVSSNSELRVLLNECGITFEASLKGVLISRRDDYSVILQCKGARLRSGRRSTKVRLVSIDIGWPHDPWVAPAEENAG